MTRYSYIWSFWVKPGRAAEFVRHYGPEGTWVELFRRAPGYIETLLLEDRSDAARYITIDRWQSEEAYRAFRERFEREFRELDEQCAALTTREESLGEFKE